MSGKWNNELHIFANSKGEIFISIIKYLLRGMR